MTSRIPVDSAEAAELREAAAERARQELELVAHDARCAGGWLGEDLDGRLVPCLTCRPHLVNRACLTCGSRGRACTQQRTVDGSRCCEDCDHDRAASPGGTPKVHRTPRPPDPSPLKFPPSIPPSGFLGRP